jgi:ferrochelatase
LNDRPDHVEALARLVLRHAQGWPEAQIDRDWQQEHKGLQESARRARELGAEA